MTLTSQKPCQHNTKSDCSKGNSYKLSSCFSIKYCYSDILLKNHQLHLSCKKVFGKIMDLNRTGPRCCSIIFPHASSSQYNGAVSYTLSTSEAWFSNWAEVFRLWLQQVIRKTVKVKQPALSSPTSNGSGLSNRKISVNVFKVSDSSRIVSFLKQE